MHVLDSNILIGLPQGRFNADDTDFLFETIRNGNGAVSIITIAEVLAGAKDEIDRASFKKASKNLLVVPFDEAILDNAVLVRANYKLKLPDAIVAATAIYLKAILVTNDTRGFHRVEEINLWRPGIPT